MAAWLGEISLNDLLNVVLVGCSSHPVQTELDAKRL